MYRLDKPAKLTLEGLGSSFIRMLGFRDVWAFVGQKGIAGFTPVEEVEPILNNYRIIQQVCDHRKQLRLSWRRHLANWTKHNVVFDSGPLAPFCEKITPSTKPEVHNILSLEEYRAHTTGNMYENFVKFRHVV